MTARDHTSEIFYMTFHFENGLGVEFIAC